MSEETVSINGGPEIPVDKFRKGIESIGKTVKAMKAGNHTAALAQWPRELAEAIATARLNDQTGEEPIVEAWPMERDGAWMIECAGIARVIVHVVHVGDSRFISFQPEAPREATQYTTAAPIKTMPFRTVEEMERVANSISMFAGTDFLEWQATAILESAKAAHWNGFSAALVEAVSCESWAPNVSVGEDKSVTMKIGRIVAKATADGLSIKFNGKPEAYLSILRGVFRGGE